MMSTWRLMPLLLAAAATPEMLIQHLPPGFASAHVTTEGSMRLEQFLPPGQSLQNWSEMVSIQRFTQAAPSDPAALLVSIGGEWMAQCPMTRRAPIARSRDSGHAAASLTLNCPRAKATGRPEYTLFRVIAGAGAMHLAEYTFRFEPTDADKARAQSWQGSVHLAAGR